MLVLLLAVLVQADDYREGRALVENLRYRDAARAFERAIAIDPDHAGSLTELVVLYGQLGERERALEAFEKLDELDALTDSDRLRVGRALRKADAFAQARRALDGVDAPEELGLVAMGDGACDEAISYFERSEPTADIELAHGQCLEALDRADEAIPHYRAALEANPQLGTARFRLGTLLMRRGSREEGLALLANYETFRQWERRVNLLLAMVSSGTLPPEETRIKTLELVDLYLQGNAFDEAAQLIAAGLAEFSGDAALRTARTRWQLATGDVPGAQASLEELLQEPEPPVDALWLSARLHLNGGRTAEAVADYERFVARVPAPPAVLLKELATRPCHGRSRRCGRELLRARHRNGSDARRSSRRSRARAGILGPKQ